MKLRACLDQCALALLRQIASAHGVALPEPPARGEVIRVLSERLEAPGYLDRVLGQRSFDERWVLEQVAAEGGQVRGFVLERRVRQRLGPGADSAGRNLLEDLLHRGLLFRSFQATGPDRGEVYLVPDELRAALPAAPVGRPGGLTPLSEPLRIRRCSSSFSLFALASFIRRWRGQQSRVPRAEGQLAALGRETAELAVELPGRSGRERWTLLAHLGLLLGLFEREEGGLAPTERFEAWLAEPEAEQRLWNAYLAAGQWNDLERAGSGGQRFAGRTAEPVLARAQVLDVIRGLPEGVWLASLDVEARVREQAPDFLREGFEVATSRLVDLESGELLGGSGSWERVEGPLVRYLLTGPLFWLGVLEWGGGEADWDRIRLTPDGRAWLDSVADALRPAPEPLVLGEGRTLLASPAAALRLLWDLEPYLALERRGPPSVYRLSRASFGQGLQAGGSAAELAALLERGVGGPLPEAFRQALERWSSRAGRLKIRPLVALLAEDEAELDGLLGRPELAGLVRERLGPRAAAIAPSRAGDLAGALERLGQLPDVDAALRLMAGRRAYSALVDQQALESLYFCLRLAKTLAPSLGAEVPNAERLLPRLEQALGPIAAGRLNRRARALARQLRGELKPGTRPAAAHVARSAEQVL